MNINLAPLPQSFLDRVRGEGIDDLNQPVRRLRAKGGEPCRDVLRRAVEGEELILASFSPFTKSGPFKEYGPIYVMANADGGEATRDAVPTNGYLRQQFVIRAYSAAEDIVDAELTGPADAEATIDRLFARPDTEFLHVRFPTYGCFAVRIDRA